MQRWIQAHAQSLNRCAMIGMIAAAAVIVWTLPVRELGHLLHTWTERLGPWGYLVFAGAYLVMSILSIPVWTMPFIAGAVFGPVWGTVLASASCVVSAAVCFGLARLVRGTWLQDRADRSPRMQALERAVEAGNWRIVAAVRFSHFLTFGLQNYAFGVTRIDFKTFAIATWLATLPGTTLQVYLGHLGFTSLDAWQSQTLDWQVWALRATGLIVMAIAVGYLGSLGRALYRDVVSKTLAGALQSGNKRRAPWGTIVLTAGCLLMVGTAAWCTVYREELRESIERWNTTNLPARELAGWVSP